MKKYRADGIVRLHCGLVGLTEDQAAKRMHAVEKTKKKGVYLIKGECCFKAGEIICLDDAPKVLPVTCLEPPKKGQEKPQSPPGGDVHPAGDTGEGDDIHGLEGGDLGGDEGGDLDMETGSGDPAGAE